MASRCPRTNIGRKYSTKKMSTLEAEARECSGSPNFIYPKISTPKTSTILLIMLSSQTSRSMSNALLVSSPSMIHQETQSLSRSSNATQLVSRSLWLQEISLSLQLPSQENATSLANRIRSTSLSEGKTSVSMKLILVLMLLWFMVIKLRR